MARGRIDDKRLNLMDVVQIKERKRATVRLVSAH
jgi:hypothetical protein